MRIQKELKAPKGQFNSFGKYSYRSCEDILEALKPLLSQNGCVLTISDEIVQVGERFYVKATAILTDCEGGASAAVSAWAREEETKKGMDGSQITGSASSYARKYALNGLFCIDDTKDADASNKHGQDDKPLAPVKPLTEWQKKVKTLAAEQKLNGEMLQKGIQKYFGDCTLANLTDEQCEELFGKIKKGA